jgi:hypothetical protein
VIVTTMMMMMMMVILPPLNIILFYFISIMGPLYMESTNEDAVMLSNIPARPALGRLY